MSARDVWSSVEGVLVEVSAENISLVERVKMRRRTG